MPDHVDFPIDGSRSFWGEIPPGEHIAQFYDSDAVFLDTLAGFIGGGLIAGETTIVIATAPHLNALEQRLDRARVEVAQAIIEGRYIAMNAETALARFMVEQWPDDQLFTEFVTALIVRGQQNGRRVRAFGEMVALLWSRGNIAATIRLERLWQGLCTSQNFSLLCAYPKTGCSEDASISIAEICAAHSRVI